MERAKRGSDLPAFPWADAISPPRQNGLLRRLLVWLWDDAPVWLAAALERPVAWVGCKRHGHSPFVEMDNTSVICAYCHHLIGRTRRV